MESSSTLAFGGIDMASSSPEHSFADGWVSRGIDKHVTERLYRLFSQPAHA